MLEPVPPPATSERQALFPTVIYRGSFSQPLPPPSRAGDLQHKEDRFHARSRHFSAKYILSAAMLLAAGAPNLSGCSSGCERIRNDGSHKMCACRALLEGLEDGRVVCRWRVATVSNRCPADLRLCLFYFSPSRLFAGLSLRRCSLERVSNARRRRHRVWPSAVISAVAALR